VGSRTVLNTVVKRKIPSPRRESNPRTPIVQPVAQRYDRLRYHGSIKGIVHFEFIPKGHTVNQAYYMEILKWLREAVHRKRPEIWPNDWSLHHINPSAHKALSVKQFVAQTPITVMEHPPYSPNLDQNDLWLSPKINFALKGRRFQNTEDIQKM
jgi:hypothetical protein